MSIVKMFFCSIVKSPLRGRGGIFILLIITLNIITFNVIIFNVIINKINIPPLPRKGLF